MSQAESLLAPLSSRRKFLIKSAQALSTVAVASAPAIAVAATPMSAAEFLAETDKLRHFYYVDTRHPPARSGGPALSVAYPVDGEAGEHTQWVDLLRKFDDHSAEFGRHVLKLGRTQHTLDSIRAGTFTPRPDFENNWSATAYVDYMLSNGERCEIEMRGEKMVGYSSWFDHLVGSDKPRKNKEYLAELRRRGRIKQLPKRT